MVRSTGGGFWDIQVQKFFEILLDALVMRTKSEQYLSKFLPSFLGIAVAKPLFGIGGRRNENGGR